MDRNLQFILDINKNKTATDAPRNAFGGLSERGSTKVKTRKIDKDGNVTSETDSVEEFEIFPSTFTTFFKRNGERVETAQKYINYRGYSGTNEFNRLTTSTANLADTSLTSIIDWTKKYPALQLRNIDFAYLKDVGVYPPNRMVVLRRFADPAPDDLFDCTMTPTNVVVGYVKFDEETALDISYKEVWKPNEKSGLLAVINDIFGKFEGTGGKRLSALPTFGGSGSLDQAMTTIIASRLGLWNSATNPLGNPNLIHEAAIRNTAQTFTETNGLVMDLTVKVTVEYVQKYIEGIDPQAAMMDALANCVYMGTSDAEFLLTGKGANTTTKYANLLKEGKIGELIGAALGAIADVVRGVVNKVAGFIENIKKEGAVDALKEAADSLFSEAENFVKVMASKYTERIRGALGAMSGAHTAPWHVTFGNPKAPWFSMGNMYVEDSKIEVPNDFAFNDYLNKLKVTYTLKPGRNRGAQEITSAFNAGKGRIYHKPPTDKIVIDQKY